VTSSVNLTVTAVDDAPVAYDDNVDCLTLSAVTVSVLGNDYDDDTVYGDSISIASVVTQPTYGTAVIDGNTIVYTPSDAPGTEYDTFTYQIEDNDGTLSNIATVHIARDDTYDTFNPYTYGVKSTILEDAGAQTYTIGIFDPDTAQDEFIITSVSEPTLGTAVYTSSTRTLVYTPYENASGTDVFTYQVQDSIGRVMTGTVRIIIQPSTMCRR
jgi:hypothetical protein